MRNDNRNDKGTILPMAALSMTAMIGFMGLGLDVGALYNHRRVMQTAADAGALAGASEIYRAKTTMVTGSSQTATSQNGFTDGSDGVSVTVNHPPTSGFYVGDAQYAEVLITQPSPTYFMQLFGFSTVSIPARAVAGVGANGKNCVYVLDPSMPAAFQGNSSAVLDASCGVIVNSNNRRAIAMSSSSMLQATSVSVTGNYETSSSSVITPTPQVGVPPEPDPLAYLQPPSTTGCNVTGFHVASGVHTLSPGVYCGGMHIVNNAHVILRPGMYVLKGGGLNMQSNAVLEGTGVTIFLTEGTGYPYGTISLQSSTQVRLTAPTEGPYKGILFYQDPTAGHANHAHHMESSSNSHLEGALYFPTQQLRLQSSTTLDARYTFIVARSISMESSANFKVRADYSGLTGGSPIKRISLVE